MNIPRPVLFGGSAIAFGLAIAWMLPPTTPIGGARVTAADARSPVEPIAPASEPAPVPQPQAEIASTSPERETQPEPERETSASTDAPVQTDVADVDGQDPEFVAGYRAAQEDGLQDRRDCRPFRGTPREDGCRAYLRDQRGSESG